MDKGNMAIVLDLNNTLAEDVSKEIWKKCQQKTGINAKTFGKMTIDPDINLGVSEEDLQTCLQITAEIIIKAESFTGVAELLNSMPSDIDVLISSNAPNEAIEAWLAKYGFEEKVLLVYGRAEGSKKKHFEQILRSYDFVAYFADSPKDFINIGKQDNLLQVAVNADPGTVYPESVRYISYEPISWEFVKTILRL